MRHHSIHLSHTPEINIPPGWLFLGFLGGSWIAVIGAAHLGLQVLDAVA